MVSQPARAVWIEIRKCLVLWPQFLSQPARAVWIEIGMALVIHLYLTSQPARAVWIEICGLCRPSWSMDVTACEGCVD